ncbi:MAG: hypothetical protein Q9188_001695 [Gyalolechia gomerana]
MSWCSSSENHDSPAFSTAPTDSECLIERGFRCRIGRKPVTASVKLVAFLVDSSVPYPSSKARKFRAEPESLDMNTMDPMGMRVASSFWATSIVDERDSSHLAGFGSQYQV